MGARFNSSDGYFSGRIECVTIVRQCARLSIHESPECQYAPVDTFL